ncbi:MAG: folylpolyglutamate synthase/dihydrofolate synthase family protein [Bacteroidota bacterium]
MSNVSLLYEKNIVGKYKKSLDYLHNHLPIFQKIGQLAYKADLSSTRQLMNFHGNPELKFKSVLVAGTNGKGSVTTLLAEIFRKNNYKVGLYTSPHFKDFRERIRINKKKIRKTYVVDFIEENKHQWKSISPSFFEITVAMAFSYFAENKVDIAIVEVGMGGRLDSTNVLVPELSIITRIGMDHQKYLGDSLEKIATEKAGIIKKGQSVIIGQNQTVAREAIERIARGQNAQLFQAISFQGELPEEVPIYQRENIGTVLMAIKVLHSKGWELQEKKVLKHCIRTLQKNILPGRWQTLSEQPKIVAEAAHNLDGMEVCLKQLQKESYEDLHIVFGTVNDKSYAPILNMLPKSAHYYWCKAEIPRGENAAALREAGIKIGLKGQAYDSVQEAFKEAKKQAEANDFVLITGSIFVIAEIL